MRIATWNVERLKHHKDLKALLQCCEEARADILVLTETDCRMKPPYRYCYQTPPLTEVQPDYAYKETENRVSIYTNYPCIRQYQTYDDHTAICVELETEEGSLLVYGTIMGVSGNRRSSFKEDVVKQAADFRRLTSEGRALCVCGDYNLSFADNYYYTKFGRETIQQVFDECRIRLLTAEVPECIDHIAVSEGWAVGKTVRIREWNEDRRLSDHKGILAEMV